MPGPPPEHPRLRLLKGNPGKHPARSPPEPARTEQRPEPPEHLKGSAREAWLHLAPELHKLNLLTTLDIGRLVPIAAPMRLATGRRGVAALGRTDDQDRESHPRVNPLVRMASQAMDDMRRIGAEFGLSPNARLRLSGITPLPPPSKFDGLIK